MSTTDNKPAAKLWNQTKPPSTPKVDPVRLDPIQLTVVDIHGELLGQILAELRAMRALMQAHSAI